jgi:hypothetical protein
MKRELEKIKREYLEEIIEMGKDGIRKENIEMMDYLTHTAKSLCGIIHSFDEESYGRSYGDNYGENYGDNYGNDHDSAGGYGRYSRRDSMGRYASDKSWMERLKRMEDEAPNEKARREVEEFRRRVERM